MKLIQSCLIALLAGVCFYAPPISEAQAETRFHLNWMVPYFPPPPPRRHYRYYYPEPYEDVYGYEDGYDDEYDEEVYYYPYYEDEDYAPPRRYEPKPRKRSKPSTARVAPEDSAPVPVPKAKKKPAATAAAKPKTEESTTAKPAKSADSVSCDKAKSILTGYGFGNVEAKSCNGKVYSFAAMRDGKSFSVKVSALNGELTEVKRQ